MSQLQNQDDAQNGNDCGEVQTCSICIGPLTADTKVVSPDCCTHLFCFGCLGEWARRNPTCPLDRKPFCEVIACNNNGDRDCNNVIPIESIHFAKYFDYFMDDIMSNLENELSTDYYADVLLGIVEFQKELAQLLEHEGVIYVFLDEEGLAMEFEEMDEEVRSYERYVIESLKEVLEARDII